MFGFPDYVEVIIISLIASFMSVMITKFLGKMDKPKDIKNEQKAINQKIRKARDKGDIEQMNKYSLQAMEMSRKQFTVNMKPMALSFGMFLVVLFFIWTYYSGWFYLYFGVVIASTFLFRKVF